MEHELLLEILSKPFFEESLLQEGNFNNLLSIDVTKFRDFLRFNEQEILIRPFMNTINYLTYDEIKEISNIYFSKHGLHKDAYTNKVKAYGLEICRFLYRNKKPKWLLDIMKYDYILFSQIWLYESKHLEKPALMYTEKPYSPCAAQAYKLSNYCKLGRFSFNIELYIDNPVKNDILRNQSVDTYLVFIGNFKLPSVQIKKLEKPSYYLLKFCIMPKTEYQIVSFLRDNFFPNLPDAVKISSHLIELLRDWKILEKVDNIS
jgi:hypothetical protein